MKPRLGLIGAGKVGRTLAHLLKRTDYVWGSVYSRTPEHAQQLAQAIDAVAVERAQAVVGDADLVLLTVSDDALAPLAETLADINWQGKGVVHTSGALDVGVLAPLALQGAMIGSLHPAFPFASVETAIEGLTGAAFAVEAEADLLREWLLEMVKALEGQALMIPAGQKALYHAALVIASNYTVTLYALAERLLVEMGADRAAVDIALNQLVAGTVENLKAQGIPLALTGPLTRADVGTVETHLGALDEADPALAALYRQLARLSLPMVAARGIDIDSMEKILR